MTRLPRLDPAPRLRTTHVVDKDLTFTVPASGDAPAVDLATYVYVPTDAQRESPRPYLHPVRTRAGHLVTAFRPHDHIWHKGIAWSLPCVGPHNFWGGGSYVHGQGYVDLPNDGSMDHQEMTTLTTGTDRADLAHRLTWHTQDLAPVIEETRTLSVVLPERDDAWLLTFTSTITNTSDQDLTIGSPTTRGRENAGYGGLFWRGPRSFTNGVLHAPGRSGGDELRGQRAPWMGLTGKHDDVDASSTVVMVDSGTNPGGEPQWFARSEDFGCICPAPFFSTEVGFTPGVTLTFSYAVVVADGAADFERAGELAALGADVLAAAAPAGVA